MLKDLADSKRLNASIKALAPEPGAASRSEADLSIHSATIVSALFWPPVAAEQLVLPGKVSAVAMLTRAPPSQGGPLAAVHLVLPVIVAVLARPPPGKGRPPAADQGAERLVLLVQSESKGRAGGGYRLFRECGAAEHLVLPVFMAVLARPLPGKGRPLAADQGAQQQVFQVESKGSAGKGPACYAGTGGDVELHSQVQAG